LQRPYAFFQFRAQTLRLHLQAETTGAVDVLKEKLPLVNTIESWTIVMSMKIYNSVDIVYQIAVDAQPSSLGKIGRRAAG
jgi:hypothetical protein